MKEFESGKVPLNIETSKEPSDPIGGVRNKFENRNTILKLIEAFQKLMTTGIESGAKLLQKHTEKPIPGPMINAFLHLGPSPHNLLF